MTARSALTALAALVLVAHVAHAADPAGAREVHGVADAFAQPGVALAWGVLRGKSEADTFVVVRVETTALAYAFVAADGIDPFTKERKPLQPPTRGTGGVDLRFPRTQFAEFPRTEFRFAADDKAAGALTVYYLGVPDTTPEFATPDALSRYLADRVARAAAGATK